MIIELVEILLMLRLKFIALIDKENKKMTDKNTKRDDKNKTTKKLSTFY